MTLDTSSPDQAYTQLRERLQSGRRRGRRPKLPLRLLKFQAPPTDDPLARNRDWVLYMKRSRRLQLEHPHSMVLVMSLVEQIFARYGCVDTTGGAR